MFIAALIVWGLLSRLLRRLIHATPLRGVDRLLGAVFGVLRGGVVLLALALAGFLYAGRALAGVAGVDRRRLAGPRVARPHAAAASRRVELASRLNHAAS